MVSLPKNPPRPNEPPGAAPAGTVTYIRPKPGASGSPAGDAELATPAGSADGLLAGGQR